MTKILLVEDDKSLREIYGVRLLAEGYDIVSAGDGEEALAMAIKDRPNLIISDVMMPKISGFDMLDILRSTTETKTIKVIMMTALSSDDQRDRGEKLGADRYLVKSQVGIEDVVRTVHEVLGDIPSLAPSAKDAFGTPARSAVPRPSVATTPVPEPTSAPLSPPIVNTPEPAPELAPAPTAPPTIEPLTPLPVLEPPIITPVATDTTTPADAPVLAAPTATPPVTPTNAYGIGLQPYVEPSHQEEQTLPPVVQQPTQTPEPPVISSTPVQDPVLPPQQVASPTVPPAPSSLPEPTAPFSSPRPASLGERVIHPLSENQAPEDLSSRIAEELATATPPPPSMPVPPLTPPQEPEPSQAPTDQTQLP